MGMFSYVNVRQAECPTYARWATGEFDYRIDGAANSDADYIVLDSYPPSLRR
ncbi:hypothetical protein [Kibdelosporangium aridum]|uniref:Uncharacterized protein n=1 Tax=Kibdelosporangium aridum TaxID=2030 RepID=A0A1Y5XWT0_KIBAR|nr:hypothetical protein [Kibdelosporangium aridum]SMD19304.1 hypothetical protein SAMN05661093_06100 [Kibdelosporangium aridum]